MKLSFVLMLVALVRVTATGFSQTITLRVDQAEIRQVIKSIEQQTDYRFFYTDGLSDLSRRVSLNVHNQNLDRVMTDMLNNTQLAYRIIDNKLVMLAPKAALQGIVITGSVGDTGGEPMPGVNVTVKGTTTGVITDSNGQYSITVPHREAVLVYSFVGYATQEIVAGEQSNISVTLSESAQEIEEIVVVGYGVQKKVNVIGSISQVSSEQLEGRPVAALSNALAGQMSGVTLIQRSGRPGASPGEIWVRGVGSFGATPEALVLIDGIPGDINDVRPEEVSSINVLKDASTAAIYGARGANGVILITTKAGKESKLKMNYSGYAGVVRPSALPDNLPSWEYAQAFNEASGTQTYTADDIQKFKDGSDPAGHPNTNFVKDVMGHAGFQTGHDFTLTGGTEKNSYYLAVGYLSQNGVVKKNNYTRYNARINMTASLASWLKLTARMSGLTSTISEPAVPGGKDVSRMTTGIILNSIRYPSVYAGRLPDGNYGIGPESSGTPIAWLDSPSFWEEPQWKAAVNARLDATPVKGLVFSVIGGYNFSHHEEKLYRSTFKLTDNNTMSPSSLNQSETRTVYSTFQMTADYTKSWAGHSVNVLAGYSFEKEGQRGVTGFRDKFPGNDLPYLDAGSPDNQQASGAGWDWAIQSFFGRIKYDYLGRYMFESTVRYDGSSRFPSTKKYGVFPSVAAGWRLSEESFMHGASSWLSNLKLKTSWGILGNQNIGNYPWQSIYELGWNYPVGNTFNQGAAMITYVDPLIHWENTQTADGGVEISLHRGLLNAGVSYFYRHTTDILYKPTSSVSSVLGMNLSEMNTGALKNTGWEFELSHTLKIKDFTYHVNGNFSIINNKVLDLGVGNVNQPNGLTGNGSDLFIGHPMQVYYGYRTDGVFLNQDDIDAWYNDNNPSAILSKTAARPGDFRFVDISGDGKVTADMDREILGSRIPRYTFALNLGFRYKGIDFNAFFQGVAGVKGRLESYAGYAFRNLGTIQRWMWEGRFNPDHPQRYPGYPRLQVLGNSDGNNGVLSNFWVVNANYLRLKNIQLGYTFPKTLMENWKMDALRIYLSAENLITWSHYRKGWDPEINTGGDYYPHLSTFIFGINLKF
ncbi:MAG: TonB-dependent receptor [Bacteroidales bacterium]|nr:TonB-dependent receptor [Bacteroidales bacterium]